MRTENNDEYLFVLFLEPFYINSAIVKEAACFIFPPGAGANFPGAAKRSFAFFTSSEDILQKYNLPASTVMYPKKPEVINQFLKNIAAEAHNKILHYRQKIDCLFNEMLVDLSRDIHNMKQSAQDFSTYSQFKKMRQTLLANCESDWTTERICRLVHIEKSQMYSYYASFFNTTPKADIISARIDKAKKLLANQELNVTQVAKMCGFRSTSHFIRAFGKHENRSPGEYAQKVRGAGNFIVLYDLREELKNAAPGDFAGQYLIPGATGGKHLPALSVSEAGGTKSVFVSKRSSTDSIPLLQIPAMSNLQPGDKITVTGKICETATSDWAVILRKYGGDYTVLAQQTFPGVNKLYSVTYALDRADMEYPVQIRINPWGREDVPPNFFVDSILITREQSATSIEVDERQIVYSLATDENVTHLRPGDITEFIRPSGTPLFTVKKRPGKKQIRVSRRTNDWDGIDVYLPGMNLKPGNLYTISAKLRIEGESPPKAAMMFQVLPGFIWRSVVAVEDDSTFVLSHTFSLMELQTSEAVRITSNPEGTNMDFTISEIEVISQ
jgi:AraC-like DNA-binding protein